MRKLFLLILISCSLSICAQELDSLRIEDPDYMEYQNNYKEGVSYFNRQDYAMASHYLSLAFRNHREDPLLAEYLYFSFVYMNRKVEAAAVYPYLLWETKEKYGLLNSKDCSFYLEGGVLGNTSADYSLPDSTLYSENMSMGTGSSYAVALEHPLGQNWRFTHGLNFCNTPGTQEVDSSMNRIFNNATDYIQIVYSISSTYNLGHGWNITPSAHVFYTKDHTSMVYMDSLKIEDQSTNSGGMDDGSYGGDYPPNDGGFDERYPYPYDPYHGGRDDYFVDYWNRRSDDYGAWVPSSEAYSYWYVTDKQDHERFNYALDLTVSKIYKRTEFLSSVSYMRYYGYNSMKFGVEGVFYPKGNLNFYSHTKCYFIYRKWSHNFYVEELVGFRACPFCWVELGIGLGNIKYYNESNLSTIYTMQFDNKFRFLGNLIFPITDRLSVSLMYRFIEKEANVYYVEKSALEKTSVANYGNSILGGIKWNF
ncbi:MAG TPA: hypothetical protein PLN63_05285 [Paludibacteraceae bacterium]|nr:hypothetical protein [Paludibacteraceae bacterium]HOU69492.1 hypothetical protein [Paludibacteraceae bacterium]HPH63013.1 hypothetical protein [Paludibacteraceae bacterium]